jgi:leucyl/phenylalanyl-tRNA--protein transferase
MPTAFSPWRTRARTRESFWVEPQQRAIMPLDGFHVSKSLAKAIRQDRFEVTGDRDFAGVIRLCAESTDDRQETWINSDIEQAFLRLHQMGLAHSVECWRDGRMVGGLYGLAMGRAFFGESMFSRTTDASKVAMAWLIARMKLGGFALLDCQFMTEHLQSLGRSKSARSTILNCSRSRWLTCEIRFRRLPPLRRPMPHHRREQRGQEQGHCPPGQIGAHSIGYWQNHLSGLPLAFLRRGSSFCIP